MFFKFLHRLVPFYFGMILGWLVFLEPKNVWIYGIFGGAFIAIFIIDDLTRENNDGQD